MKIFNLFIMSVIISIVACKSSQSPNSLETKYEIIGVMHEQVTAWNSGDIEGYMKGYWNSDSLRFVSGGNSYSGWTTTLDGYKNRYPDKSAMGELSFTNLEVILLAMDAAIVFGKYQLNRENDDPWGLFTLVLRKTADGWRIMHDHTSQAEM
ncbi:YybH family protein [Candidatus Neomarinimicrobiota bacterium]